MSMKIVFLIKQTPAWQEGIQRLQEEFPHVTFVPMEEHTKNDITQADAIVCHMVKGEHLQMARNLKVLFFPFAGPMFLPLKEIAKRNILIANAHGNAQSVAERGLALTLAFYGHVIDYHHDCQSGKWHGAWGGKGVADTWDSLYGKTSAIIGSGEIGKCLARLLKAFGCKVIGFKKRQIEHPMENFDVITLDLDQALTDSELVYVTLPLTPHTKGMFNGDVLSKMKGKFLVNLGRGEVVEEEALYNALKDRVLKGAAIDVWYRYPEQGKSQGVVFPSRFAFHELPNVVLSPHVAGLTPHSVAMNVTQTIDNIRAYLKTGRPLFEIDSERMY
jgi:phosphoglycerate dehydrogenase-like enzyme